MEMKDSMSFSKSCKKSDNRKKVVEKGFIKLPKWQ